MKLFLWCSDQRKNKKNADIAAAVSEWKARNGGVVPPPGTKVELPSGADEDIGKWIRKTSTLRQAPRCQSAAFTVNRRNGKWPPYIESLVRGRSHPNLRTPPARASAVP